MELNTCDHAHTAGCNAAIEYLTTPACPEGPVPQCPFPDPLFDVFFPHPNDCQWFFHCINGVAYCRECPADLYWNVALDTCDYRENTGC
jgi:hypothetical protein